MITLVYWLVMIVSGAYFWSRRFDIFTLAFLSSCVYFMPAAVPTYPMETGAYLLYMFVLVSLFVFAALAGRRRTAPSLSEFDVRRLRRCFRGAFVLFIPLLLVSIFYRSGTSLTSKLDGENGGLLHYSLSAVLGFLFVSAVLLRRRLVVGLCLAVYAWIVLAGDRTQFVIAMLSAVTIFASYREFSLRQVALKLRWHHWALIVLTIGVGLFGKTLYGAYFDANSGSDFVEALQDRATRQLSDPVSGFEPYHVQSILDLAVKNDDRIPSAYLLWLPVQVLPFAANLGSETHGQSEAVKAMYFSDWSKQSGVSSNFFAEGYLLWGYLGAIIFCLVYASILVPLSRALTSSSAVTRIWACFAGTFWAFYIHRSSIFQIVSHEKRILYAFVGVIIVGMLIQLSTRISNRYRS